MNKTYHDQVLAHKNALVILILVALVVAVQKTEEIILRDVNAPLLDALPNPKVG
jgi:hypothetical protein